MGRHPPSSSLTATLFPYSTLFRSGRGSPTREAAHIPVARWSYDHTAIIATVTHARGHDNVAYEIFYPAGPFAILPMLPGNRSAIVWSVKAEDAPAILDLPDRALAAEIEKRMGGFLRSEEHTSELQSLIRIS